MSALGLRPRGVSSHHSIALHLALLVTFLVPLGPCKIACRECNEFRLEGETSDTSMPDGEASRRAHYFNPVREQRCFRLDRSTISVRSSLASGEKKRHDYQVPYFVLSRAQRPPHVRLPPKMRAEKGLLASLKRYLSCSEAGDTWTRIASTSDPNRESLPSNQVFLKPHSISSRSNLNLNLNLKQKQLY